MTEQGRLMTEQPAWWQEQENAVRTRGMVTEQRDDERVRG